MEAQLSFSYSPIQFSYEFVEFKQFQVALKLDLSTQTVKTSFNDYFLEPTNTKSNREDMTSRRENVKNWLNHAFAVKAETTPPSQAELLVMERICLEVVKRRMTTPALTFLEMVKPLNYVGSQVMQFFHPMASAIADARDYATFAKFLERRDSIDPLAQMYEEKEAAADRREKETKGEDSNGSE